MKINVFLALVIFSFRSYCQLSDTVYIQFNSSYHEMEKVEFKASSEAKPSYSYWIQQLEETYPYDNKFSFSHYNKGPKAYEIFGGKPPVLLQKEKHFLRGKNVLDINFFRSTPYIDVSKTFEEEDSWKQDVLIFIVDVDEMKNDSIVLREVYFTRPVKE